MKNKLNNSWTKYTILKKKNTDVPKQIVYDRIPYIGYLTDKLKSQLLNILYLRFPQLQVRLVTSNKHKNILSLKLCSGVICVYECESCKALYIYIGSIMRQLKCRFYEPSATSVRSGNPLAFPPFSFIQEHQIKTNYIKIDNFSILTKVGSSLLTMESLCIYKFKLKLSSDLPVELFFVAWLVLWAWPCQFCFFIFV